MTFHKYLIKISAIDFLPLPIGKPFIAGENTFLLSNNFYPYFWNLSVYGFLKKKLNNKEIFIRKIYMTVKNNIILKFPQDYCYSLVKSNKVGYYLTPKLLKEKNKLKDLEKVDFIKQNDFYTYLKEEHDKTNPDIQNFKFYKTFIKVGNSIDRSKKTVKESMLYFRDFIYLYDENKYKKNFTLEDVFLSIEIETKEKLQKGREILPLAENKLAILLINDIKNSTLEEYYNDILSEKELEYNEEELNIKDYIKKTKYFKIILLTPTNYPPEIEGAKRIAQLTGKPIAFSGWFNVYDEDKKIDSFPSRLFKLIPAGSVFYYKIDDEITKDDKKLKEFTEKLFDEYWLKPSFFVPEYPYFEKAKDGTNPLGFGLSIIGVAQVEED